jgi:Sigma-70, region 4
MSPSDEILALWQTPILDVLQQSDVSARLLNAITAAADNGELPLRTVGEYLQANSSSVDQFMRIRNLGRKSADELDRLIHEFVAKSPASVKRRPLKAENSKPAYVRQLLIELFVELTFPDIFLQLPLSVRLANALRTHQFLTRPFSALLDNRDAIVAELFQVPYLGRDSLVEFREVTRTLARRLLYHRGLSDEDISDAMSLIFEQRAPAEPVQQRLELFAKRSKPFRDADLISDAQSEKLKLIITDLLRELAPQARTVIQRRYGIGRKEIETLEEIAVDYHLTRERVRQTEATAIRRLALPINLKRVRPALDNEIGRILVKATDGALYIKEDDRSAIIRRFDGSVKLAIDLLYDDRYEFLDSVAVRWKNGWLLSDLSIGKLNTVLAEIRTRVSGVCLPAALEEIVSGIASDEALAAIHLGTDLVVLDGYLLERWPGARCRRTIRLHKLLVASGRFREIRDLLKVYYQVVPDDRCSVRDAEILMTDAPHLFLRVLDSRWYAFGTAASVNPAVGDIQGRATSEVDFGDIFDQSEEKSIRVVLRRILTKRGPLRFVDLRKQASRRLRGKSLHSVGPILLTSGEFVRPLPGIYALPGQLPSAAALSFNPPKFLLNEEQARWFAMARQAGEPFGRYSMWTPEVEYALCRWSQNFADQIVFQSLLAVASIGQWPVSKREREHWTQLKQKNGEYGLARAPRYPFRQLCPTLDRVLAACLIALDDKGLSWITANRVLKLRVDAHVSAGLLALLVSLDALEPAPHWQSHHKPGNRLNDLVELLSAHLHKTGILDWTSTVAAHLIRDLKASQCRAPLGWVDNHVIADLIAGVRLADFQYTVRHWGIERNALSPKWTRRASYRHKTPHMAKRNSKRREWTKTDVRELKTLAREKTPARKIARTLKRTEGATRQKAFSLGVSLDSRA